jgi:hypothetical protein
MDDQVRYKAPSKRQRLDQLIDWYEKHRPTAGLRIATG